MAAAEPPLCQGRPDVAPHPWTDLSVSAPPDGVCVWPRPGILKLCEAAKQGDMEAVRQHLDSGESIDQMDEDGMNALAWACSRGKTEVAILLLDRGAKVDHQNRKGQTALMWASSSRQKEVAELLLERSANIDLQRSDGYTALMVASYGGTARVWAQEPPKGAQKGRDDTTEGDKEMVEFLFECGARADLQANNGMTSLAIARARGHTEVVALLERGSDQ